MMLGTSLTLPFRALFSGAELKAVSRCLDGLVQFLSQDLRRRQNRQIFGNIQFVPCFYRRRE
jgi:hypothetical protein